MSTGQNAFAKLATKLYNVQQNVPNFPMNGWNSYSKYAYPLFQDIVETLKPVLRNQQLVFYFNVAGSASGSTQDGKKNYTSLTMCATVVDIETGESLSIHCPGYAEDSGDKSAYQAHTNARKYALLSLFGLNSGIDQETSEGGGTKKQGGTKKNSQSSSNNQGQSSSQSNQEPII